MHGEAKKKRKKGVIPSFQSEQSRRNPLANNAQNRAATNSTTKPSTSESEEAPFPGVNRGKSYMTKKHIRGRFLVC